MFTKDQNLSEILYLNFYQSQTLSWLWRPNEIFEKNN